MWYIELPLRFYISGRLWWFPTNILRIFLTPFVCDMHRLCDVLCCVILAISRDNTTRCLPVTSPCSYRLIFVNSKWVPNADLTENGYVYIYIYIYIYELHSALLPLRTVTMAGKRISMADPNCFLQYVSKLDHPNFSKIPSLTSVTQHYDTDRQTILPTKNKFL